MANLAQTTPTGHYGSWVAEKSTDKIIFRLPEKSGIYSSPGIQAR